MITVISDVGGDTVRVVVNGAVMVLRTAEAFQLSSHLQYTLEQLIADQVMKERQEFITARYKP